MLYDIASPYVVTGVLLCCWSTRISEILVEKFYGHVVDAGSGTSCRVKGTGRGMHGAGHGGGAMDGQPKSRGGSKAEGTIRAMGSAK